MQRHSRRDLTFATRNSIARVTSLPPSILHESKCVRSPGWHWVKEMLLPRVLCATGKPLKPRHRDQCWSPNVLAGSASDVYNIEYCLSLGQLGIYCDFRSAVRGRGRRQLRGLCGTSFHAEREMKRLVLRPAMQSERHSDKSRQWMCRTSSPFELNASKLTKCGQCRIAQLEQVGLKQQRASCYGKRLRRLDKYKRATDGRRGERRNRTSPVIAVQPWRGVAQ